MYLHLGGDIVVRSSDIIGIFDIENTSVSKLTKEYLGEQEKRHRGYSFSGTAQILHRMQGKGWSNGVYFTDFLLHPAQTQRLYRSTGTNVKSNENPTGAPCKTKGAPVSF